MFAVFYPDSLPAFAFSPSSRAYSFGSRCCVGVGFCPEVAHECHGVDFFLVGDKLFKISE